MRTWTRLIPVVLLALPFTGSWLRADGETNADAIKQLQNDVKKLKDDVAQLRKDITDNAAHHNANAEQLRAIREILDRMAARQETIRLQPGYDPRSINPLVPSAALPAAGMITLQNHYSAPATVHINDRFFRVEPNQILPITGVPPGTFQYSVDVDGYGTVEPLRTDTLRPAGYRITIFPRMPY